MNCTAVACFLCFHVSLSRLKRVMGRKGLHFCYCLPAIVVFLFEGVSSSSGFLGKTTLFHSNIHWALHMIIVVKI